MPDDLAIARMCQHILAQFYKPMTGNIFVEPADYNMKILLQVGGVSHRMRWKTTMHFPCGAKHSRNQYIPSQVI